MFDDVMLEHQRDFIIFHLDLSDEVAKTRLAHRKICSTCGTTYSNFLQPDLTHCSEDQTLLSVRVDDQSPQAVAERLALYHTETAPIIAEYAKAGKVVKLDASLPIDTITQNILSML